MQQPLAYIFQTLFQHEVFIITPTLNAGLRHVMLVMATRITIFKILYKAAKNR